MSTTSLVTENGILERMIEDDGKLRIIRTQDVEPILDHNARLAQVAPKHFGEARFRHVGSIPFVLAETWSRECGHAIGTKEFGEYLKKKLLDGDFAKLRVKGF